MADVLPRGYRPAAGAFDEMLAPDGSVRPVWRELAAELSGLSAAGLGRRYDRADRYLADAGVFYRLYGLSGTTERRWPLSHIPLVIAEGEWNALAGGLVQRAAFLEALAADIYGESRLVAAGLLPPQLIAGSPEFLRPMVGHRPVGGHFLHFVAFDLGRGPDGRWWVLGDRTQAPSGAGFALENRVATTRAFGDLHAGLNIHRLAGFFRDFRDHLTRQCADPADAVAIVTPGPLNETYFEHAYIARYLGLLLLEGEDLAVVGGRIMVRTVSGLKPVGVLWRRLDAGFMDPLELDPASRIGTPGLVGALRTGAASMVNALGSGVLETRALLAFMPRLSKALIGETLAIPNIATWWCGGPDACRSVRDDIDRMMIGPAFATGLAIEDEATRLGSRLDEAARTDLFARLDRDGASFVGQEAISLSTMPVDVGDRLEPRPVVLRAYAARTAQGWTVMPGGFARVGSSDDRHAISMQRGGAVADVWVRSARPVAQLTLIATDGNQAGGLHGLVASRTADNLFWLGRYVERAEGLVRVLRAYHTRLGETLTREGELLRFAERYLKRLGVDAADAMPSRLERLVEELAATAGRVRDRFSPDGWLALSDLSKTTHQLRDIQPGDDAARGMTVLLRKLAGFSGLVHENMVRSTGWRFLEIGRRLERADQMARLASHFAALHAPEGALDMLLEVGDSVLAHRRRYAMSTRVDTHLDLLVRDADNPRSIGFQLGELEKQVAQLPQQTEPLIASVRDLAARLDTNPRQPRPIPDGLIPGLAALSDRLGETFFR